jgi:hypothetical protein
MSATITASYSGTNVTAGLTVTPVSISYSIWDATIVPSVAYYNDQQAVELGVKFSTDENGYITALRFYRGSGNTGANFIGHLWSASGTLLATATFPTGTTSGWQQVELSTPVAVTAGTTYVASYYTTSGYAVSRPYFTSSNEAAYRGTILYALIDGEVGGNGVYRYGSGGGFPSSTYESTNYWVDVVFQQ